jgi:hypothetical protein
MEPSSTGESMSQAVEVRQLPGEGECPLAPLQGLLWVAQIPEDPGGVGVGIHPKVIPLPEGLGAVMLGVVEGNRLLLVGAGPSEVS